MTTPDSITPAVAMRHVSFAYNERHAVLHDINLCVHPQDFLAILGPNGSGKTTLLKLLLGLLRPSHGSIEIFGYPAGPRAAHLVGYVPQYARFDSDFPISVMDVVLMGRLGQKRLCRGYTPADLRIVRAVLQQLELTDLAQRPIGQLSGGQLQRVLIGRALAMQPRMLLLDEPTASLDTRVGEGLWEILKKLTQQMTIVVVSHDIGAISHHVTSVACLNRELYYHPEAAIAPAVLEKVYGCPVELLAHGHPHRVLGSHDHCAPQPDAGAPSAAAHEAALTGAANRHV